MVRFLMLRAVTRTGQNCEPRVGDFTKENFLGSDSEKRVIVPVDDEDWFCDLGQPFEIVI